MSLADVEPYDWDRCSQVAGSVASGDSASHVASSMAGSVMDDDELEHGDLDILSKPTKKVLSKVATSATKTGPLTYARFRDVVAERVEELMDVDGSCYDASVMPDKIPLESQDGAAVDEDTPLTVSECLMTVAIVLAGLQVERHRAYEAKMARLDTQAQLAAAPSAVDGAAADVAASLAELDARPYVAASSLRDALMRPHTYWRGASLPADSVRGVIIIALGVVLAWVLPLSVVAYLSGPFEQSKSRDAATRVILARAHIDVLDETLSALRESRWAAVGVAEAAAGVSLRSLRQGDGTVDGQRAAGDALCVAAWDALVARCRIVAAVVDAASDVQLVQEGVLLAHFRNASGNSPLGLFRIVETSPALPVPGPASTALPNETTRNDTTTPTTAPTTAGTPLPSTVARTLCEEAVSFNGTVAARTDQVRCLASRRATVCHGPFRQGAALCAVAATVPPNASRVTPRVDDQPQEILLAGPHGKPMPEARLLSQLRGCDGVANAAPTVVDAEAFGRPPSRPSNSSISGDSCAVARNAGCDAVRWVAAATERSVSGVLWRVDGRLADACDTGAVVSETPAAIADEEVPAEDADVPSVFLAASWAVRRTLVRGRFTGYASTERSSSAAVLAHECGLALEALRDDPATPNPLRSVVWAAVLASIVIAIMCVAFGSLCTVAVLRRVRFERRGLGTDAAAFQEKMAELTADRIPPYVEGHIVERGVPFLRRAEQLVIAFADPVGSLVVAVAALATNYPRLVSYTLKVLDRVAVQYGLTKGKTVGDGYLGVVGLQDRDSGNADGDDAMDDINNSDGHAAKVSRALAFACVTQMVTSAAYRHDPRRHPEYASLPCPDVFHFLPLRMGVHTGAAMVGVLGTRGGSPDWECLGPNVVITRRLEEVCPPGRVLVSNVLRRLIQANDRRKRFEFEASTKRLLRGVGTVRTALIASTKLRVPDAVLSDLRAEDAVRRRFFSTAGWRDFGVHDADSASSHSIMGESVIADSELGSQMGLDEMEGSRIGRSGPADEWSEAAPEDAPDAALAMSETDVGLTLAALRELKA